MKLHVKLPDAILQEFLPRCRSCYGLCCVALARSIPDGFPETRLPGEPCSFLQPDFRCAIHAELSARGLFGCETYHCLGAGQMVSGLFSSGSWRLADSPDEAREIYRAFLLGEGLKLTLWYLAEASTLLPVQELWARINRLLSKGLALCGFSREDFFLYDLEEYLLRAHSLLRQAWSMLRRQLSWKPRRRPPNCVGRCFQGWDTRGMNFSASSLAQADFQGCDLWGANFLGADIQGADFRGADLSEALFLTPGQIGRAITDETTRLPQALLLCLEGR